MCEREKANNVEHNHRNQLSFLRRSYIFRTQRSNCVFFVNECAVPRKGSSSRAKRKSHTSTPTWVAFRKQTSTTATTTPAPATTTCPRLDQVRRKKFHVLFRCCPTAAECVPSCSRSCPSSVSVTRFGKILTPLAKKIRSWAIF